MVDFYGVYWREDGDAVVDMCDGEDAVVVLCDDVSLSSGKRYSLYRPS
jgi:hypothetical protein